MTMNEIRGVGNFHRAGRRDMRRDTGGVTYDRTVGSESGPDESAPAVLRLVIDEVLETLPDSHRSIIEMRVEGYKIAEIAERTQRSKRAVERVHQKFCQRLDTQIRESA
jgi:DNA-directed RNA polymerase specialized sigma24 family protein